MPFAPLPPTRKTTGLWRLGFRFESLHRTFLDLGEQIQDVWLIGDYLALPFIIISSVFLLAQTYTWQADQELGEVLGRIEEFLDGWIIVDILEGLWSDLSLLRTNPIIWVLNKVRYLWSEFEQIRNDPIGWFREKINRLIPSIWQVIDNTRYWLLDNISRNWPLMGSWFNNPFGSLRDWVYNLWPIYRTFINNPGGFVLTKIFERYPYLYQLFSTPTLNILERLYGSYPFLRSLFTNPRVWIINQMNDITGLNFNDLDSFVDGLVIRVMTNIRNNRLNLRGRIENLIHDIIVSLL